MRRAGRWLLKHPPPPVAILGFLVWRQSDSILWGMIAVLAMLMVLHAIESAVARIIEALKDRP